MKMKIVVINKHYSWDYVPLYIGHVPSGQFPNFSRRCNQL